VSVRVVVQVKNVERTALQFKKLRSEGPKAAARGLYKVANQIMTDSKRIVPILHGVLASTGYVAHPVITGSRVTVNLGYGGPAAPYAVVQHENLSFHHKPGRQAKYLESPAIKRSKDIGAAVAGEISTAFRRYAKR
jgi:hypothetical protein